MGIRLWRWLAPVLVLALSAGVGLAFLVGGAVHADAVRRTRRPRLRPVVPSSSPSTRTTTCGAWRESW